MKFNHSGKLMDFNKMDIKNIIFDLGNVLIDLEIDRTWQSLKHLLGDIPAISADDDLFIQYEIGKISEASFFNQLREMADTPLSIRQLQEAWNAMLLGIKPLRFPMLSRLKEKYNLYVLSNTNETHLNYVDGYLKVIYKMDIQMFENQYFIKPYYSHIINLRKPNTDIYEYVLQDAGLKAGETLFIDDNTHNIEGAKKVGLRTMLHPIGVEIAEVLREF
jgi:putative hydrolase of the HAD superfamily